MQYEGVCSVAKASSDFLTVNSLLQNNILRQLRVKRYRRLVFKLSAHKCINIQHCVRIENELVVFSFISWS